jgi:rubrerythrin
MAASIQGIGRRSRKDAFVSFLPTESAKPIKRIFTLPRPLTHGLLPSIHRSYADDLTLEGTQTLENLKAAFAGAALKNRRYIYFAQKADVEGLSDAASQFKASAEVGAMHAMGHLEFLEEVADPTTGMPMGDTITNLESAIAGETFGSETMYPEFAEKAREEGFEDIAAWFERVGQAENRQREKFNQILQKISNE